MNRKEFIRRVASVMRENNIKKPICVQKQVFHISDNEGNSKDFVIKKKDISAIFTVDDVEAVVEACMQVVRDSIRSGEEISIPRFGVLGLNYRQARETKHPVTGERVDVKARYVPKFIPGKDLKLCAKIYEVSLDEKVEEDPEFDFDVGEYEEELS